MIEVKVDTKIGFHTKKLMPVGFKIYNLLESNSGHLLNWKI